MLLSYYREQIGFSWYTLKFLIRYEFYEFDVLVTTVLKSGHQSQVVYQSQNKVSLHFCR